MRRLFSVFSFVAITLLSRVAFAVPAITGSSGTYSDGGSVTITGSGFGGGPNVVLFDDFESGTVGNRLRTGAGSATVGQWDSYYTPGPYYTGDHAVSGSKAFQVDRCIAGPSAWGKVLFPGGVTEVFMSWWTLIPSGTEWPGEDSIDSVNWKVMWLQGTSNTNNDMWVPVLQDGGTNWTFGGNNFMNWGTGDRWIGASEMGMIKGQWKRMWFWGKGDPGATTNGAFRFWALKDDGAYQLAYGDNSNLLQDGGAWHYVYVFGYGRASCPSLPTYDDVYLATGPNARARVEIGNASTYSASTKLTVATPTAWSASSITANFRRGNLATGTNYLYVFDSTGAVNATGYPITVSGGAAPTQYTATCSAGSNGTCTPASQTVDAGQSTSFTITPNSGYTGTVAGTCGGSPSTAAGAFTYTTNAINANCSVTVTFAGDTTPPVISAPLPSGEQPYGTGSVTLQVTTNEAATCRYNATDVAYASMGSTFGTTGGTTHQQAGFATANGSSYTRYVRCIDAAGNASAASTPITFSVAATDDVILDNDGAGVTQSGDWSTSTYFQGYYGSNYHYAPDAAGHWFQWTTSALAPGSHAVYARWPADAGRPSDVVYEITHSGGTASVPANQTANGSQWNLLGTYTFGATGTVRLLSSATGTEGAAADAIRFSDSAAPVLSGLSPTGDQAAQGTSIALALTTNEPATCRYDLNGVSDYDSMSNYTTTGGTSHSATVTVRRGGIYAPAVKCRDAAGNTSASPAWRFAVPDTPRRRGSR